MPTFHKCIQGESDWSILRAGKVTASEMDALVSPTFKIREGVGVKTYLYKKLAEAYKGLPLPGFSSFAMEQGQEREDEARRWYGFEFEDFRVDSEAGFIEHDDGRCGCSPDALLGDGGGLEIKCPEPVNHVRYLVEGKLPDDYAAQVHMSLYVTGRAWWRFISYRRGYPAFVLHVERDEEKCAIIAEALAAFYPKLDAGLAKLREAKR